MIISSTGNFHLNYRHPIFYFHVSSDSRRKYQFEDSLFSLHGDLIIADFPAARVLARKINDVRIEEGRENEQITPGLLNALGLIHEIYHLIIRNYETSKNPGVFRKIISNLTEKLSAAEFDKLVYRFVERFPPPAVYQNRLSVSDYINADTEGKSHREIVTEELLLLHLENINPSVSLLKELFDEEPLIRSTAYSKFIDESEKFFDSEIPAGPEGGSLIKVLKKPIITNPYDIEGQIDYIKERWGVLLNDKVIERLLKSRDLIREDIKLFIQHGGGEKATPPVPFYDFDKDHLERLKRKLTEGVEISESESLLLEQEKEQFTADVDWMPNVVMMAKNIFVWLDQLSKKYNRAITTLDSIPDEELDLLSKWNITALWLIGIWERSSASRKIKQYTGNPDAASSAYSLYDYVIAAELGGEQSFENLKARAARRGIRMASDMVPNHTGIYSKWVIEKPHYFIQTDSPPFPGYTFFGPNLSDDKRVEIRIEDKYYSKTDAAVVFQRRDSYTGSVKYIYHGNDGTNMPWNDTAQLNLLLEEVREAVIQTIKHVARKTPIIRFDAAMTLTKKHYQRLWFPQPGSGGAIPSRTDYSMTRSQFDKHMPVEFWREVVDRINSEMPETLLLAEAFWLMEGYFVRTLGMHRVYNSAFMHMLMKEENDKYKLLIKNTLAFNPEILKRYVNFMSNPDEETAINQFGKGDKYFGVALLMVTLPGLPMFGHGQVEGYSEKYGMEYRRAYYNELPDVHLIQRHEKEIFPLLKKRYLFSQVENFELFDVYTPDGQVNENVIAFTNSSGDEKVVVIYNNSYKQTSGVISHSSPKMVNSDGSSYLRDALHISEVLNLDDQPGLFYIYQEHRTGLYHLISAVQTKTQGLYFSLSGYQYEICMYFRKVYDQNGDYHKLFLKLDGKGVPSIDTALRELHLEKVHDAISQLFENKILQQFKSSCFGQSLEINTAKLSKDTDTKELINSKIKTLSDELNALEGDKITVNSLSLQTSINDIFTTIRDYNNFWDKINSSNTKPKWISKAQKLHVLSTHTPSDSTLHTLFSYCLLSSVRDNLSIFNGNNFEGKNIFDEFMISIPLIKTFERLQHDSTLLYRELFILKLLLTDETEEILNALNIFEPAEKSEIKNIVESLLKDKTVFELLNVHEYINVEYFNKERFEELLQWLFTISNYALFSEAKQAAGLTAGKKNRLSGAAKEKYILKKIRIKTELFSKLISLSEQSGYKLKEFKELVEQQSFNGNKKSATEKNKGLINGTT